MTTLDEARTKLALANRILAHEGVVDGFGRPGRRRPREHGHTEEKNEFSHDADTPLLSRGETATQVPWRFRGIPAGKPSTRPQRRRA